MSDSVNWQLIVQRILYAVQFRDIHDRHVADEIARAMIDSRMFGDPPAVQLEGIRAALASGAQLVPDQRIPDADFRFFLNRVVESLEDFRPWPVSAFTAADLSIWDWSDYRPIAEVKASVNRFPFLFEKVAQDDRDLLVAVVVLRSGAIVALAKDQDRPDLTLLCQGSAPAGAVILEFAAAMRLDRDSVTPVG
ncbi:hypothetical protein [Fodinicola acaciae]|uniref:hypothetical protein n=1 Tax=Fodinicola acaciae TaxID=2681555 RepID=UPI0013D1F817|nr:hypothetical protein [Fodinicola acaciae]